jgi:hypothetical protein
VLAYIQVIKVLLHMTQEHSSEQGEPAFHSPLEGPEAQSPEVAAPSQAEHKLSFAPRFREASVEVSDAESEQAASDFKAMVDDFMLQHASEVKILEMVDGYPTSHVDRQADLEDGSDIRISVVTRGEGIPKEARGGLPGAPMEVFARAFNNGIPGRQLFYRLDGKPRVVRREEYDDLMSDTARSLEAAAALGDDDLMASLGAALEPQTKARTTETASQELEEEMGVNNREIGLSEVGGLRHLLAEFA